MSGRLLSVDAEVQPGDRHRCLWVGAWGVAAVRNEDAATAISAELDRLYAAAEANQAPGPDWKAKLREQVEFEHGRGHSDRWNDAIEWVLSVIDALPDPPTPDPDAPPVYVPPEGHHIVLGGNVSDGWEGRAYTRQHTWYSAAACRKNPTTLFEVRRVPAPEPATEWVPLTKLVGRTIKGETEPVGTIWCAGEWRWTCCVGGEVRGFPLTTRDDGMVEVLAEGERS